MLSKEGELNTAQIAAESGRLLPPENFAGDRSPVSGSWLWNPHVARKKKL